MTPFLSGQTTPAPPAFQDSSHAEHAAEVGGEIRSVTDLVSEGHAPDAAQAIVEEQRKRLLAEMEVSLAGLADLGSGQQSPDGGPVTRHTLAQIRLDLVYMEQEGLKFEGTFDEANPVLHIPIDQLTEGQAQELHCLIMDRMRGFIDESRIAPGIALGIAPGTQSEAMLRGHDHVAVSDELRWLREQHAVDLRAEPPMFQPARTDARGWPVKDVRGYPGT